MHPPALSLAIRVDPHNADHHLWRNHGTWWIHYVVHEGHRKRRVRRSLATRDLAEARAARDAVFARLRGLEPVTPPCQREVDAAMAGGMVA